jgi:hypothetical protein
LTSLKPSVCFLVDTREQEPLAFGPPVRTDYFSCATTRLAALREGDYSVALNGRPLLSIRLERKSLGDLHGRVGFQRARFEAELRRLRAYDYRGIIIEATPDELTPVLRAPFPRGAGRIVKMLDNFPEQKLVGVQPGRQNRDSGRFGRKTIYFIGAPSETRTPDPLIKSQLLYQLS